jgi:hypothetical protein
MSSKMKTNLKKSVHDVIWLMNIFMSKITHDFWLFHTTILVVDFFLNQEKCTKCLYIGENPLFQLVLFLSKMCVKCRIWLKKYKNFLGWRGGGIPPNPPSSPRHFHLGYCFLIWDSSSPV